jgi:hypothetical protein
MKKLVLASIFSLAFALSLRAQDPPPAIPQLVIPPPNIGVWHSVQGVQTLKLPAPLLPRIVMPSGVTLMQSHVCSVPLLEANTTASDPGIAVEPKSHAVAMPQANLPAPPCPK